MSGVGPLTISQLLAAGRSMKLGIEIWKAEACSDEALDQAELSRMSE
jgi:hypothetical protein